MHERQHGRLGRIGLALVRKRSLLLLPLFAASLARIRPVPFELALELTVLALALVAWSLRVWAMGYRNWVRAEGERHLMTRGPYAFLRHPRYLASFLAGLAWFALVADPVLGAVFVVCYWAILATVIVREEEKLAQDYPGFAGWRARVPALFPALWRWREVRAREPGEAFDLATVTKGLEPLKLAGFLVLLGALAWGRRAGLAFHLI
jgi:protein-S-isoprenylcysteine O-methyltransferase Ste14